MAIKKIWNTTKKKLKKPRGTLQRSNSKKMGSEKNIP